MTLTFHRMIDFRYNDFEMAKSCYRNRAFVDFVWSVITLFTYMSLFVSLSHSHSGLLLVLIHIYLQRSLLNCHKNLIEDKAQRGDNSKSFCRLKCIIACKYTWAALQKSATFLLSFLASTSHPRLPTCSMQERLHQISFKNWIWNQNKGARDNVWWIFENL